MFANKCQLLGAISDLSKETVQSRLKHLDDQGPSQEKSNPYAANPLQKPV